MATFNNVYTLAFAVSGESSPEGEGTSAATLRSAIVARLEALDDDELLEAVGLPVDSYEE